MHAFRPRPLMLALSGLFLAGAHAQSLSELYEAARGVDASYQSARAQGAAGGARPAVPRAGLLPPPALAAGLSRTELDSRAGGTASDRSYSTQNLALSASHPLYRPANSISWEQAGKQVELARAQLTAAEQDLIVRLSQAYFDVLAAQESLAFVQAQKTAVTEQLAAARRNFEVGTATITDTREAQAKFDLVVAQQVAAENDLRVRKLALDLLTGRSGTNPVPLKTPVVLPALAPDAVEPWVSQALDAHPSLRQAQLAVEIATLESRKAQAGHSPTLDLTASHGITRNPSGSANSALSSRSAATTVGLAFNLPLFTGYAVQNRVRETLSLEEKARADLETARRSVTQAVRTAYFGVQSGAGQAKALEAAEASSQSALDANKLGYQVGVRINIDVLNSQSQLFQTKRDLAQARYSVLVNGLRLRQASGVLKDEDLRAINALLGK